MNVSEQIAQWIADEIKPQKLPGHVKILAAKKISEAIDKYYEEGRKDALVEIRHSLSLKELKEFLLKK